jgi:hypothetical protein
VPRKRQVARAIPAKFYPGWRAGTDKRFRVAKVASKHHDDLTSAVGGDPTPQEAILIERVVWGHMRLQQIEQAFLTTGTFDTPQWIGLTNALVGLLRTIGLKRVAKKAPTLAELLAAEPQVEEHEGAPQ